MVPALMVWKPFKSHSCFSRVWILQRLTQCEEIYESPSSLTIPLFSDWPFAHLRNAFNPKTWFSRGQTFISNPASTWRRFDWLVFLKDSPKLKGKKKVVRWQPLFLERVLFHCAVFTQAGGYHTCFVTPTVVLVPPWHKWGTAENVHPWKGTKTSLFCNKCLKPHV